MAGFSLGGADANNYVLASTTETTTANVTANALTTTINGGAFGASLAGLSGAQRSQIVNLTLNFANSVVLAVDDLSLMNMDGFATQTAVSSMVLSQVTSTQYVITFNSGTSVVTRGSSGGGNSLSDGNYLLSLASNGEYRFGAAAADNFFRLFGDVDGDGDVDGIDATYFRRARLTYNAAFDINGDGTSAGTADTSAFTMNNGKKRKTLA